MRLAPSGEATLNSLVAGGKPMVASTSLPKRHLPLGVTMYHCSALAAEITHIIATAVMLRNLYIGSFLPTRATLSKSSLACGRKIGHCRARSLDNPGQIIDLVVL